ncbi:50S ribosomal protein L35 [Mycoplasma marinum]|uniref:Large ribosomal subunit protein bL35 n=1 Tax=Mycoplasma marinum TaxID=1937190 RepID=A0A4R0XSZ1_9MOLU|nr:50S ribosomal protein L35 [Mycoplasma marinum]TCG12013.1 50S ribosomal protein L35 [Mycoplasma marinum]
MAKMKTKSALTKRVKVTGTGKVKRGQAYRSHLAQNKSTKQKRQSRKSDLMSKGDMKRLKGLY